MTEEEIKALNRLQEIMALCEEACDWKTPVDFDMIIEACYEEKKHLKIHIGSRLMEEYDLWNNE